MDNLYKEAGEILTSAKHILVLQADNPDGDSLGSALALEAILSEMGKNVTLVCAVDMPSYLRYLSGWDRVQKYIPTSFDATIIVDTSSETLFEYFSTETSFGWIKAKPVIVVDHHASTDGLSFADVVINETAVATSEVLFRMAGALKWPIPADASEMMAVAILSDSIGLMSEATTAETFSVMSALVEKGANLARIDNARRMLMSKSPELVSYKGILLQRITVDSSGKIASITIPWTEIEKYSPHYNPSMLVMDDMRMITGVQVAIAYKTYPNGRITGKIRCNYGYGIAGELGSMFGGGGHPYAAGFKVLGGKDLAELQSEVNSKTIELLAKIESK